MLKSSTFYKVFNFTLPLLFVLFLQACSPKDMEVSQADLGNPEALVTTLEGGISSERKQRAELFYQDALEMIKQKRWGVAYKGFGESALHYPSAKALLGASEAMANSFLSNESEKGIRLKSIKRYLESAVAVDEIQKELSTGELEEVKNDIACIDQFITSGVKKDNCKYVDVTLSTLEAD